MVDAKRLVLLFIVVTAVAASSKCGKRSQRSKYGKQTSFQSVQRNSMCKYRIRADRGMHIKLVLNNYYPESCCLQVKISPRGKNAGKLQIPAGPRSMLTVKASEVDVIIKSSSAARVVNISHEGVLPEDGDLGFAFRATKKVKIVRTPNFPKVKLPSGIASVWNVTASPGQSIRIEITGLSTSANQDFLEIFDGAVSLGRYSGKKKRKQLPIVHNAKSRNMVIVLDTQTAQSRGFRAKIVAKDMEESAEPRTSDGNRRSLPLQCHKRVRVTSNGGLISDNHSRMICNNGEVCGRMLMVGSSVVGVGGINISVTNEMLHCIPQSMCTGSCGDISPPDESIVVKSCELSCCNTDMCNASPDTPDVAVTGISASLPFWLKPPGGLHCNEGSSVRRELTGSVGSGSGGNACPQDSVCALYVFSGVSNDTAMEKVVGYVNKCTPEAECLENSCPNSEDTRDVNFNYCNTTCCKTDYCNDPYEANVEIPTLPPREPVAEGCLRIRHLQIGDNTLSDDKYYTNCAQAETRCVRVDAYVKNSDGKHGIASFGKCIAKNSCDNLNCSSLLELDESVAPTSCVAECCHNDYCNERPLRVPVPIGEENALWCHSQSVIVREGAVAFSGERSNILCKDGEVCAHFKFFGTSTEYHEIGEPMAGYWAMCQPPSACNENTCQTLSNAENVKVTSCDAKCCNTSMCNEPGEVPMPSPRTPVEGFSSQCYSLMQTSMNGKIVINQTRVSTCGSGAACLRIDADTAHSGLAVKVAYGACIPKLSCRSANCDALNMTMPGIPIHTCRVHCCDTDLCNSQPVPIPSETTPIVQPSLSTRSESGGTEERGRCYDTLEMRSYGVLLPGNKKDIVTCEPNSQCYKISSVASHSSLPGVTVTTTIGGCAPKASCAARDCTNSPAPAMDGTVVESCEASCCDGDLCNN